MSELDDKVMRIHGNKLRIALQLQEGKKIDKELIVAVAKAKAGDTINVAGVDIKLTMAMIGVARVILDKIGDD